MAEAPTPNDTTAADASAATSDAAAAEKPKEQYIRTFAADMETVKAGKRPDLKPYKAGASPALDTSVAPSPAVESAPAPAPVPAPIAEAPEIEVPEVAAAEDTLVPQAPAAREEVTDAIEPSSGSVEEDIANLKQRLAAQAEMPAMTTPEERLIAGSSLPPVPEAPLPSAAPEVPPSAPPPERGPAPLHTYSEDFVTHAEDTHASAATVLAAEQDAGRIPRREQPHNSGSNALYIIAGIVLLLAGAGGAYWGYLQYQKRPVPVVIAPTVSAPIFVDTQQAVHGTGTALAQEIEQATTEQLSDGTIRFLYFPPSASSTDSVFDALQLAAPGKLVRNVNASGSMAGILSVGGAQYPFFILSVSSYGDTFAGMLEWEPHMLSALSLFYPELSAPVAANPVIATTTATTTGSGKTTKTAAVATSTAPAPSVTPGFKDETIANHDARVYFDAYGRPLVVYGYWDQQTLIIARDEAAFSELVGRIANSRKQ